MYVKVNSNIGCCYWREGSREVDFVLHHGGELVALEVKSGRVRDTLPGMDQFSAAFAPKRKLLIGGHGMSLDEFLSSPVKSLFAR